MYFVVVQLLNRVWFLWSHGLQHIRLPYTSLSPRVCWNSCLLNRWYYLTISSSVIPFSFCLQSFPVSESFPMSWLFKSGSQSLEIQLQQESFQWILRVDFFMIDCFDLLAVQETLKSLLQDHSLKTSILWWSAFFMVQLSHLYVATEENVAF